MNRMWMLWMVLLFGVALVVGCQPKPAPTPPPPPIELPPPPPPPKEVMPPPPPPPPDVQERPWYEDKDLKALNDEAIRRGFQPNVYFELDKSDLKTEAREQLAQNARFLRDNPDLRVNIEGHCDERGTDEYNLALGDRRANAARDYLVSLGVGADRMRTRSYGEERPVCTESQESCWWQNRRAYMVLTLAEN